MVLKPMKPINPVKVACKLDFLKMHNIGKLLPDLSVSSVSPP